MRLKIQKLCNLGLSIFYCHPQKLFHTGQDSPLPANKHHMHTQHFCNIYTKCLCSPVFQNKREDVVISEANHLICFLFRHSMIICGRNEQRAMPMSCLQLMVLIVNSKPVKIPWEAGCKRHDGATLQQCITGLNCSL